MASLIQFANNMRKRGRQVGNSGARMIRRSARRTLKSLVNGTAVDTGEARSNWRVGIGRVPIAVIKPYAPGKKLGIGERANATAAIAAGNAVINRFRPGRGFSVTKSLHIANNTKHIGPMNSGLIKTAAIPGFIQFAILEAQLEIRNFRVFSASNF